MHVLITGANGFVGKNMAAALANIRDGKDRTHPGLAVDEVFCFDVDGTQEELDLYCAKADFVLNFAGVNRPKDAGEFMRGNHGFASALLDTLKKHKNTCPVMLASSVQASLIGRYADSEYGKSKLAAEELFFAYGRESGANVLVYRFPGIFGKWARPGYNSVIATFCHNTANDLPIRVDDRDAELELLYIDDLIRALIDAMRETPSRCDYDGLTPLPTEAGTFCYAPRTHRVTLGRVADLLGEFHARPSRLLLPDIPQDSFEQKLYSTYLSYLPAPRISAPLKMNADERGSFTELFKSPNHGQVSVNISKPGITKGNHWHHSKWEIFIVVSGRGRIRQRRIGTEEILDFEVSGENIEAVHILPGYTHSIENLSDTQNLVTVMWASECFDPDQPDTHTEPVE